MNKRPIRPMAVPGITPAAISKATKPKFVHVDPSTLIVDETYQRNLSEKSVGLIRKIVGDWDWARFKPPVVAITHEGMEVMDGQHTAIAAASHPDIRTIPVMVVTAAKMQDRAKAFMGHNRDRINVTTMQLHYSAIAAGEEGALAIQRVTNAAGATVLKYPPGSGLYKAGDTVAIESIRRMIKTRGEELTTEILCALVQAQCAPISDKLIKAVDVLLHDAAYAGQIRLPAVTTALLNMGELVAIREAKIFAAAHRVPIWRALAVVIFQKANARGRRRAA